MKNLSKNVEGVQDTFYFYVVSYETNMPRMQEKSFICKMDGPEFLYSILTQMDVLEEKEFTIFETEIVELHGTGFSCFMTLEGNRLPVKMWPALCDKATY